MALGTQAGWYYYRNTTLSLGDEWNSVGFNVLTGEIRWVTPVVDIVANVTNFNFTGVDTNKFIQGWFNHPNGITFQFSDAQLINNGNNVNGVTCIWSPFYQNPNEVLYLSQRDSQFGQFINTGGLFFNPLGYIGASWYWDNINIYQWLPPYPNGEAFLMTRYNTNTKEQTSWIVPNLSNESWGYLNSYANNNGLLGYNIQSSLNIFGQFTYLHFTSADQYLSLQSNNYYPTNMFGSKTYSTYSGLLRNVYNLGVEIDEYKNVQF
jgi:hypothetical protein